MLKIAEAAHHFIFYPKKILTLLETLRQGQLTFSVFHILFWKSYKYLSMYSV